MRQIDDGSCGAHESKHRVSSRRYSAGTLPVPTKALMLALIGCSPLRSNPFGTHDWPKEIPSGLCIVEVGTTGNGTRCTGATFRSAQGRSYALTAKHCIDLGQGATPHISVLMPATERGKAVWRNYRVSRVLVPRGPATRIRSQDQDAIWRQDWAIAEFASPEPPPSIARLLVNTTQTWSHVSLQSFFDRKFDHFYPHTHDFALDDAPQAIFQGGHSGSPILSNGQIVAVFSGYRETQTLLVFHSRTIALTSVKTIHDQLKQCNMTLNFESLSIPPGITDSCELMNLAPDETPPGSIPKVG